MKHSVDISKMNNDGETLLFKYFKMDIKISEKYLVEIGTNQNKVNNKSEIFLIYCR